MKKISYYLGIIVIAGIGIVSFWIYQKYFKVNKQPVISFQATRGDIREAVNVRGEVVSQREFELEFPFGGTVKNVYVKEGVSVKSGIPLLKLDTNELDLERSRLSAVLAQREAALEKLLAGAQKEDVNISRSKVSTNERALHDAEIALYDAVATSFTVADDAIHNKADQFFDNPRTQPALNLEIANSRLENSLNQDRVRVESLLSKWKAFLPSDATHASIGAGIAHDSLVTIKSFLFDLATAMNTSVVLGATTQATFDTWKASILSARTAVDGAITLVVSGEEKVRTAESALSLARSELALKESAPRNEDVRILEAQITETKSAVALVDERIKKSTLRAPGAGIVKKILVEEGEVFKPGMTALMFASDGHKIQADVSELDISKVRYVNGNEADIRFDAFSGKVFKGKVVFIEPKEVIKNEDVYFRTDLFLDGQGSEAEIRPGMSADVVLYGAYKKRVLLIPELAVEKRGGKSYARVVPSGTAKENIRAELLTEQEVVTGVSDGENIEIVSGLAEGAVVVVSSD